MGRSLWLTLALVALGLWASLVPQVTYPSASSGTLSKEALIAWPGWGVQQDLGSLGGTVGRFQFWASSKAGGHAAVVHVALVDTATREVLRQHSIGVSASYIPTLRTVTLPSYVVPEGQQLQLQLQVEESEQSYVAFRLADPQEGIANLAVNGVPDFARGPLAFAHLQTGSGLRAAISGEPSGRIRLALAVLLTGLATVANHRIMGELRLACALARRVARRTTAPLLQLARQLADDVSDDSPNRFRRIIETPWYPWLFATIPILQFLIGNPLHFAATEALIPVGAALIASCASVVGLRLILRDWDRPAAITATGAAVFFAYGHIERALDKSVDERVTFAGAVVLAAVVATQILRSGHVVARLTQFLNLVSSVLLVFLAVGVGGQVLSGQQASRQEFVADCEGRQPPSTLTEAIAQRPDIYYIVLDSYGRHDALGEFDNQEFLQALEDREFYVAQEATSNYRWSHTSITSSMNMSYLSDLGHQPSASAGELLDPFRCNALISILKRIGYEYIHLESGYSLTNEAPLADQSVSFSPSGVSTDEGQSRSRGLARALMETTLLRPIGGRLFMPGDDEPFDWWAPERTLEMIGFLTSPIQAQSPKFVFAHIVKPHLPATFDQNGNIVAGRSRYNSFKDKHDPDVPDAYTGQLIYINSLVLDMIDGILASNDPDNTVIVITSDHGRPARSRSDRGMSSGEFNRFAILAAFHMPNNGSSGLYPAISSVNHFRYILDRYFGLGLGLLDDRIVDEG